MLEQTYMTWTCPRCLNEVINQDQDHVTETSHDDDRSHLPQYEEVPSFLQATDDQKDIVKLDPSVEEIVIDDSIQPSVFEESSKIFIESIQEIQTSQVSNKSQVRVDNSMSMSTLEAIHQEHCSGAEEDAWIFAKPMMPPVKPVKKKKEMEEHELEARPGKNWRRSISQARRSIPSNLVKPVSTTPSTLRQSRRSFIVVPTSQTQPVKKSVLPTIEDEENSSDDVDDSSKEVDKSLSKISKSLMEMSLMQITEEPEEIDTDKPSFLEKLLGFCSLEKVVDIYQVYDSKILSTSTKVGEGAFGEVFLINSQEEAKPVLKVVPIGGELQVNGEEQTSYEDISSEVMISSFLSQLRQGRKNKTSGFVELRKCNVFQGKYPKELLKLWDMFDKERESENDRPDFFPKSQQYIALEFGNGGKDLEKFVFNHPTQALAAWRQVAHTLAVAEQQLSFEHRDLHWGNILIKETKTSKIEFRLDGDLFEVATEGVETNIIDFSLSRLTSQGITIFSDKTQDPTLFTAKGKDKPGGDYQFDIYRMMRSHNKEDWETFNPKTNIFWLHYMLDKMADGVYYSKSCKKSSKLYKSGMKTIKDLKDRLLSDYDSATEFVKKNGLRIDN